MSNRDREIDKTYLSIDGAEERGLIHRDYIAHCFRWTHVARFLNAGKRYESAIVLDAGCGKEMPLAKTLYVNRMSPTLYVGVDANRMAIPEMLAGKKIKIRLFAETDFCQLRPEHVSLLPTLAVDDSVRALPNVFTSFEVLEHMEPATCRRFLQRALELTSDDCHYFLSTPCWNGSAAANHINEMSYQALGALFEDLGFHIESKHGTFASIKDYESQLQDYVGLQSIFEQLREYYDTNILATIFAPLFPARSRNVLWHLTKWTSKQTWRAFKPLPETPGPWSQHPNWRDLAGVPA